MRKINVDKLKKGIPKIAPGMAQLAHEVLLVALLQNGHQSGVILKVIGTYNEEIQLIWSAPPSSSTIDYWKNPTEVANFAAVGLGILLMLELTNYNSFDLALFGTGIDYWMSEQKYAADSYPTKFRKDARLEISGIFKKSKSNTLNMRINVKKEQVKKSSGTGLFAWIVVTEFGQPKSKIKKIK